MASPQSAGASDVGAGTPIASPGSTKASAPSTATVPWRARANHDFWHGFARLKLEQLGLSEAPIRFTGRWRPGGRTLPKGRAVQPCRLDLALDADQGTPPRNTGPLETRGLLYNVNTIEQLTDDYRARIGSRAREALLEDVVSGRARDDPSLLNNVVVLSHADIKRHVFQYWTAHPRLDAAFTYTSAQREGSAVLDDHSSRPDAAPVCVLVGEQCRPLSQWAGGQDETICFIDASTHATAPSAMLHNLVGLLVHNPQLRAVLDRASSTERPIIRMLAWRGPRVGALALQVEVDTAADVPHHIDTDWETTKLTTLDLGATMDPAALARSARDLNLQLMKWRVARGVDLRAIGSRRCLLLGAGTLGCYVARLLVAWGVDAITFVDSGRVSHSNPARQPLFTFDDAASIDAAAPGGGGFGRPKAEAAAANLRLAVPSVECAAEMLEIPMSGHVDAGVASEEAAAAGVLKLWELVKAHDAIFVLTDSRESRWLPTVLAAAERRPCYNAALGFDTFLAMRHGVQPIDDGTSTRSGIGEKLGCYFCNDVVAPGNSLKDRTLDQMCTVTRPGLAALAAAHLVEMFASASQPAPGADRAGGDSGGGSGSVGDSNDYGEVGGGGGGEDDEGPLGTPPHVLRGSLRPRHGVKSAVQIALPECTACSPRVLAHIDSSEAAIDTSLAFLVDALKDTRTVEEVSGLAGLRRRVEELDLDLDLSSDDGAEAEDAFEAV